jgi:hypothetical protein
MNSNMEDLRINSLRDTEVFFKWDSKLWSKWSIMKIIGKPMVVESYGGSSLKMGDQKGCQWRFFSCKWILGNPKKARWWVIKSYLFFVDFYDGMVEFLQVAPDSTKESSNLEFGDFVTGHDPHPRIRVTPIFCCLDRNRRLIKVQFLLLRNANWVIKS